VGFLSRRLDAFSSECSTQPLIHFFLHSGYGLDYVKLYTKVWRDCKQCDRTVRRRMLHNKFSYIEIPHIFFIKCIITNNVKSFIYTQFNIDLIQPDCVVKVAVAALCER
jgi:hypothetical protein